MARNNVAPNMDNQSEREIKSNSGPPPEGEAIAVEGMPRVIYFAHETAGAVVSDSEVADRLKETGVGNIAYADSAVAFSPPGLGMTEVALDEFEDSMRATVIASYKRAGKLDKWQKDEETVEPPSASDVAPESATESTARA